MLDAIKDANIEVGKEIIPILKPEVNKQIESPYSSEKLTQKKRKKLRVMSIVMKNQDNSILTSLTVSQQISRMNSNSGEVVWDSTDKRLYLASLGPEAMSDRDYQSGILFEKIKEEGVEVHPQGYREGMIRVEEHEQEENDIPLNEEKGNRRMLNLGGMLR